MHFIDDIDLVFSFRGRIGDLLPDLPDIVHAVVGRRIDLNDIHGRAGRNGPAGCTCPARISILRMLTVDRPGKDLRDGRLSGSSCPAE